MPPLHLQSVVVVGGAGLAGKCHNFSSRSGMEEVVRGARGDKRMEGKKQSTNIAVVAYFRRIQNFVRCEQASEDYLHDWAVGPVEE